MWSKCINRDRDCEGGLSYYGRVDNGYVCVIKIVELCDSENDVIQESKIYFHPGVRKMLNYVTVKTMLFREAK